jgi:hypothetical protein
LNHIVPQVPVSLIRIIIHFFPGCLKRNFESAISLALESAITLTVESAITLIVESAIAFVD